MVYLCYNTFQLPVAVVATGGGVRSGEPLFVGACVGTGGGTVETVRRPGKPPAPGVQRVQAQAAVEGRRLERLRRRRGSEYCLALLLQSLELE